MAIFAVSTTGAGKGAGKNDVEYVKITRVVPVYASVTDPNSTIIDTSGTNSPASGETATFTDEQSGYPGLEGAPSGNAAESKGQEPQAGGRPLHGLQGSNQAK